MLDAPQRDLLLGLTPAAFDDDRVRWARIRAGELWLRGRLVEAREAAQVARDGYLERLAASPEQSSLYALAGMMQAILGQTAEAVRNGERAAALVPIAKDAFTGSQNLSSLATVHVYLGHEEKAIETLEQVLESPWLITPGWLRVNPLYDSLRGNPRFEKLAAGTP